MVIYQLAIGRRPYGMIKEDIKTSDDIMKCYINNIN